MFAELASKLGNYAATINPWGSWWTQIGNNTAILGTIYLTPQSPTIQYGSNISGTTTYYLPRASSCPNKIFLFCCYNTTNLRGASGNSYVFINTQSPDLFNNSFNNTSYTQVYIGRQSTSDVAIYQSDGKYWNQLFHRYTNPSLMGNVGIPGFLDPFYYASYVGSQGTLNPLNFANYFNTAAGNLTCGLGAIGSGAGLQGKVFLIVKSSSDANTVTISPGSTDTINGSTNSIVLSNQYDFIVVKSVNGSPNNWFILASSFGSSSTTLAGSISGNMYYTMPLQGIPNKKFVLVLSAVSDAGRTINYPKAFTQTPGVFVGGGVTGAFSSSTTQLTVPALTAQTGTVIVEGL